MKQYVCPRHNFCDGQTEWNNMSAPDITFVMSAHHKSYVWGRHVVSFCLPITKVMSEADMLFHSVCPSPFCSEYKWILYLTTMYVYCVYPAMSKKVEKLVRFKQKGQKQAPFLAFHKCCQGCLLRGLGQTYCFILFVHHKSYVWGRHIVSFCPSITTVIYPAISTFAVQICYMNKFLLYQYVFRRQNETICLPQTYTIYVHCR
jgi:hypothetical protein